MYRECDYCRDLLPAERLSSVGSGWMCLDCMGDVKGVIRQRESDAKVQQELVWEMLQNVCYEMEREKAVRYKKYVTRIREALTELDRIFD